MTHQRDHTSDKPFECESCHKTSMAKLNLNIYRIYDRIQTSDTPFACDICHKHDKRFTGEKGEKAYV